MKSCHNCRSKTVLKDSGMQPDPDLGAEGHSALVPLVDYQGCSCDSFTWTVCIFKNRKQVCTYLYNIDYVNLSQYLHILYVHLSQNLHILYVHLGQHLHILHAQTSFLSKG